MYYADVSAELAEAFVESVEAGISSILDRPRAWKRVGRRVRRYLLHRFPYGIHYVVQDDVVIIVAIAHMRRRPGYWRDRV